MGQLGKVYYSSRTPNKGNNVQLKRLDATAPSVSCTPEVHNFPDGSPEFHLFASVHNSRALRQIA
jgi:hypothetical protein